MTDLHVPVIGADEGYLYVAHGDRCVLLCEMDVPKWRNATGLTSAAARRLAAILVQQADAADQVRREDRFTSTEPDAAQFEQRRGQSDDAPDDRPTRLEAKRDEADQT